MIFYRIFKLTAVTLWVGVTCVYGASPTQNTTTFTGDIDMITVKKKPVMSQHIIKGKQLDILTSRTMFSDISDSIKLLPGVVSFGEFDANMYVRGGGADEILYTIDDHYLGKGGLEGGASAFGGRLTRINTKLVDQLTFYSGGFPARYGNVLSAVLDVTYKTGSTEKTQFDLEQNITELNWIGQGPIEEGKSSWLLGYRRTYYDLAANLFFPAGTQVPYLYNYFGKYFNQLSDTQKLYFSYDHTGDGAHLSQEAYKNFSSTEGHLDYDSYTHDAYLWLESAWTDTHKTKIGLGYSTADLHVDTADSDSTVTIGLKKNSPSFAAEWENTDYLNHKITSGFYYHLQNISLNQESVLEPGSTAELTTVQTSSVHYGPVQTHYYGIYTQDEWQLAPELALNMGIRHEKADSLSQSSVLQPRFTVYVGNRKKTAGTFSIGRYTDLDFKVFNDNLVNLAPRQAMHYVVGIEHHQDQDWMVRLETYYKDYTNLTYATKNAQGEIEGYTNEGKGYAYGIEFFLQKLEPSRTPGAWYGWISYSLSQARNWDPYHLWYAPLQDVTHVINLTGGYYLDAKVRLLQTTSFGTGRPYTAVVGRQWDTNSGQYLPIWGDYQGARLPAYLRTDLWIEYLEPVYPFKFWFDKGKLYFGLGNIFNYRNIYGYTWNSDYSESKEVTNFNSGISLIFGTQVMF